MEGYPHSGRGSLAKRLRLVGCKFPVLGLRLGYREPQHSMQKARRSVCTAMPLANCSGYGLVPFSNLFVFDCETASQTGSSFHTNIIPRKQGSTGTIQTNRKARRGRIGAKTRSDYLGDNAPPVLTACQQESQTGGFFLKTKEFGQEPHPQLNGGQMCLPELVGRTLLFTGLAT